MIYHMPFLFSCQVVGYPSLLLEVNQQHRQAEPGPNRVGLSRPLTGSVPPPPPEGRAELIRIDLVLKGSQRAKRGFWRPTKGR